MKLLAKGLISTSLAFDLDIGFLDSLTLCAFGIAIEDFLPPTLDLTSSHESLIEVSPTLP